MLGGMAAKVNDETLSILEQLGEVVGLLFQIKDDEIGLFGTEAETGKSVLSDVREGKKTLYYHYVFQLASTRDQARLKHVFGSANLTLADLEDVRSVIKKSGTKKLVDSYLEKYAKQAFALVEKLPVDPESQAALRRLIEENILRTA
jgi:geranylgeranyl diphosphate synthase type I